MQYIILKDIYDTPDLSRNTTALGVYNSKRTINKIYKHIHTSPPPPHMQHTIKYYMHRKEDMPDAQRQKMFIIQPTDARTILNDQYNTAPSLIAYCVVENRLADGKSNFFLPCVYGRQSLENKSDFYIHCKCALYNGRRDSSFSIETGCVRNCYLIWCNTWSVLCS